MIESPLIKEIVDEVTREVTLKSQQNAILNVLEARLGPLPEKLGSYPSIHPGGGTR